MNLYFLVEGRRSEMKIYPSWLEYLLPNFKRVYNYNEVQENNYYLISAEGYPSIIYDSLPSAIEEIQDQQNYDYLILCLDSDEVTITERKQEINDYLSENQNLKNALGKTQLKIIVQNRCIETWLLGNRKIYTRNPQDKDLLDYTRYYNVADDDPEKMGKYNSNTHAAFHEKYLKALFKAKNMKYSKEMPRDAQEGYYLEELQRRVTETEHLSTLKEFIDFCQMI